MEFLRSLLEWLVSLLGPLVAPDWGALIRLLPIGALLLVAGYYAWVLWRYARAGRRRVGLPPRAEVPPAGIHLPGPSLAPFLISAAAAALFFSVALGGIALWVAAALFVAALLAWGREAFREYESLGDGHDNALVAAADAAQPAEPAGPPEGVHLPPPSLLPFLVSLGAAVLLFGAAIGASWLLLGAAMTALALVGWLVDAGREYRAVEAADASGHLVSPTPRRAPLGAIVAFSLLFVFVGGTQAGIFGGGAASPSPSPSGPACAPDETGVVTICAEKVAFLLPSIELPAGEPRKLRFVNYDVGIPHNVAIHEGTVDAVGKELFQGEIFNGADERTYTIVGLPAGEYVFVCTVHPNMVGSLSAK